jgi:hypothetical protein
MPNPDVRLPGVNQIKPSGATVRKNDCRGRPRMTLIYSQTEDHPYLQQAALVFLRRYQAQHPGNDQVLFCKAVRYLVTTFELSTALAEKLSVMPMAI